MITGFVGVIRSLNLSSKQLKTILKNQVLETESDVIGPDGSYVKFSGELSDFFNCAEGLYEDILKDARRLRQDAQIEVSFADSSVGWCPFGTSYYIGSTYIP